MSVKSLQGVADLVVHRAQRQGYVIPREVREELAGASLPESFWKDVLALARASLNYRRGRYYYSAPVSDRVRAEQSQQQDIRDAVERLVGQQAASRAQVERRGYGRIDYIQPVKVTTEAGQEFTLLTRDLSTTGLRLIGTRRLLGQKVRVVIPGPDGRNITFVTRILWTCPVGDDLVENGGTFLSVG